MVVKINFFLPCQAQISALATRALVTLSLDWLAFAVKLVLVDSCIWKIARVPCAIVQLPTIYRECQPIKCERYPCTRSQRGNLRLTQEKKIDFYHRGN